MEREYFIIKKSFELSRTTLSDIELIYGWEVALCVNSTAEPNYPTWANGDAILWIEKEQSN
jgi:hypothetical protein